MAQDSSLEVLNRQEYKDFSLDLQTKTAGEKQFVKAQFELTYGCNLHCVHCYTDPLNKPELLKKEIPLEKALQIIDKLQEEGILWLCFTGGEIFMRRDFLTIYDYAWNKGFLITLFTNGTLITEKIVEHLAAKPPFSIEISFHGATPDTFDKITKVKGSYEKCVEGIKMLLARSLPVRLKTGAMTLNYGELDQIKAFVESLGLKFQVSGVIYPRLDGDVSSLEYRLDPKDILEIEFDRESTGAESCAQELTPAVLGQVTPGDNLYRCSCGKLQTHIDPYGKAGACTWSRKGRFDLTEVSLQQGMSELAEELHSEKYPEHSACHSCQAFAHCEKVVEMAHLESGDTFQPVQHFCDLAFGRLERVKKQLV
ncbi:MAG: radical SAM protein [Candidatus Omnitrophica bacterium]|nr:radical SAM protein [Candidatus Omnitrophota bacterium]